MTSLERRESQVKRSLCHFSSQQATETKPGVLYMVTEARFDRRKSVNVIKGRRALCQRTPQ